VEFHEIPVTPTRIRQALAERQASGGPAPAGRMA